MQILDAAFDVLVVEYGIVARVYANVSSSVVTMQKVHLNVGYWKILFLEITRGKRTKAH